MQRQITGLLSLFILLFLPFSSDLHAQGEYMPDEADYSFPRTIIERTEIPEIRASLSDSLKFYLYSSIVNTAKGAIPPTNISHVDRGARARIAREAAFVLLMQKDILDNEIIQLSSTDSAILLGKTISLLETLNESVGIQTGWNFYWEWQLRSKELIEYLIAYDLLRGKDGVPVALLNTAKIKLQQFAGNLYSKTIDLYPNPSFPTLPLEFYSYNPNNHAIRTCSALGIAAIVLNDASSVDANYQPANWMNAAMWNIDNTLWKKDAIIPRVSDVDALVGYAESPNYFSYAFENAMPFIRSMWNFLPDGENEYTFYEYNYITGSSTTSTRSIKNPWYDANYHNLYEWMNRIRMPDGSFPAVHDSGVGHKTMLTSLSGIARYNIPFENHFGAYNSSIVRSQFISTIMGEGTYDEPLFQALPEAGSLIFRSTYNEKSGLYMHLIGKNGIALTGAKAHHQADAMSFQLYFNGKNLALDPGYSGSVYRADVEKATDHNLILVNGKGPGTPTGEFVSLNNEAYIENSFDLLNVDYGEIRGRWEETDIVRKTLFLREEYFIIADFVKSENVNNYTFQLHGNGLENENSESEFGSFSSDFDNQSVLYKRDTVSLLANISSRGQTNYSAQTDSLSLGAAGYKEYTKTLVHENNITSTEFLSILFPYNGQGQPSIETIAAPSNIAAQRIFTASHKDLVFTQPENESSVIASSNYSFVDDVTSNGNFNFVSFSQNDELQNIFIENGNSLSIGNQEYFKSNQFVDISLDYSSEHKITGYISGPSTIELNSDAPLSIVYGNISSIEFNNSKVTLTFTSSSYFRLTDGTSPVSTLNSENDFIKMELFPNPTEGRTTIKLDNIKGKMDGVLKVFSLTGQEVFEEKININAGENFILLDLNNKGIFVVQITTKVGILTSKLNVF